MRSDQLLTTGGAALQLGGGVQQHHLLRLARAHQIPFQRVGRLHLLAVADLETVREVCRAAGFYRPSAEEGAARD